MELKNKNNDIRHKAERGSYYPERLSRLGTTHFNNGLVLASIHLSFEKVYGKKINYVIRKLKFVFS